VSVNGLPFVNAKSPRLTCSRPSPLLLNNEEYSFPEVETATLLNTVGVSIADDNTFGVSIAEPVVTGVAVVPVGNVGECVCGNPTFAAVKSNGIVTFATVAAVYNVAADSAVGCLAESRFGA
jgi:hypothetical protein